MAVTLTVGNDGNNTLQGGGGSDLIYGFDPLASSANVSTIAATRVATSLSEPLFVTAPPNDTNHLFVVEQTGRIRVMDLTTGQFHATPFLDVSAQITLGSETGLLGLAFAPDFAANGTFYVNLINTAGN